MTTRRTPFAPLIATLIGATLIAAPAFAQKKELTPQQQHMGECAHEGKGKKGDEYKQFMKQCLKSRKDVAAAAPAAKPAAPASAAAPKQAAAASQKDKMKSCNVQAKEKSLKGDARKSFMSDCLKA